MWAVSSQAGELPFVNVSESNLEIIRQRDGQLESETAYAVHAANGHVSYGYSPDGTGMYWYDTREELTAEHGW